MRIYPSISQKKIDSTISIRIIYGGFFCLFCCVIIIIIIHFIFDKEKLDQIGSDSNSN